MKLTLNETWKQCLSMWWWIAKEIRKYGLKKFNLLTEDEKIDFVDSLKEQWLVNHDFDPDEITNTCFFCEKGNPAEDCSRCPGHLVDPSFYCYWDTIGEKANKYNWCGHPIAFYNKLVSLNRKRLKQKGKKCAKKS